MNWTGVLRPCWLRQLTQRPAYLWLNQVFAREQKVVMSLTQRAAAQLFPALRIDCHRFSFRLAKTKRQRLFCFALRQSSAKAICGTAKFGPVVIVTIAVENYDGPDIFGSAVGGERRHRYDAIVFAIGH